MTTTTEAPCDPTIEDIRKWFGYRRFQFQYIDIDNSKILKFVRIGWTSWVAVIGHPEDASYEWVGQVDAGSKRLLEASNRGYGSSIAALRDGLCVIEPPCGDMPAAAEISFEVA